MALALLLAAALLTVLFRNAAPRAVVWLASLAQIAALALAGLEALDRLQGGRGLAWGIAPPELAALRLDALGAVFVLALAAAGGPVALYAPGYLARGHARMSGPWQQALLCILEASILGVLVADDGLWLLVAWELMTASATALVLADGHRPDVSRAALIYVVMSHVGTILGIVAILLLGSHAGDLGFAALRTAARGLSGGERAVVLLLGLVGFGAKAGVVPLHVWLPEAHPAAPSHVSALLSGVIVKVGIYAVVRVTLDLAAPVPAWYGFVLLAVGIASALLGVLYALMEHDLKRLLAFHTVENVGIIVLGIGLGVTATQAGAAMRPVASLALAAGLFHVINHAVFKGLLFLCAGSVQSAIHDRNLEEMGGLLKTMPWTGAAFLTGALAISGMPPLNGFASEWTILQALIGSGTADSLWLRRASPLLVAGFALMGALAAACFVKAFGIAFLGLPRSDHARHATEVGPGPRAAQALLALTCLALGLASPVILPLLSHAGPVVGVSELSLAPTLGPFLLGGPRGSPVATTSPVAIFAALAVVLVLAALFTRPGRLRARRSMTWVCGLERVEPRMQYSSSAFAKPIRLVFRRLFQHQRDLSPKEGAPPYSVRRWVTHGDIVPIFDRFLYEPLVALILWLGGRVERLASPSVETGLLLTLVALVAALWSSL